MRTIVWTGVILMTLAIQSALLPFFAYKGICPDLLLLMVVSAGVLLGKEQGVGIGFFCGLLQDLASGNVFGINILSKMAIGYLFGLMESKVFKEHVFLPVLAAALASGLNSLLVYFILFLLGNKVDLITALSTIVVPMLLYNVLLSIPVHKVIYKLTKM
jgi:rod shape-determining protein MreD